MILLKKEYCSKTYEFEDSEEEKKEVNKVEDSILEMIAIKLRPNRLPRKYNQLIVISVYIPPRSPKTMQEAIGKLTVKTEDIVMKCTKNSKPLVVIMGDFNGVDTSILRRSLDTYVINKKATRKDKLLDLIITNAPRVYRTVNMTGFRKSDHQIVLALPLFHKYKKSIKYEEKISIRKGKLTGNRQYKLESAY